VRHFHCGCHERQAWYVRQGGRASGSSSTEFAIHFEGAEKVAEPLHQDTRLKTTKGVVARFHSLPTQPPNPLRRLLPVTLRNFSSISPVRPPTDPSQIFFGGVSMDRWAAWRHRQVRRPVRRRRRRRGCRPPGCGNQLFDAEPKSSEDTPTLLPTRSCTRSWVLKVWLDIVALFLAPL